MSRVKQASKRKRVTKAAVPALGAAGLTFSLVGGASAAAVPTADVKQTPNYAPTQAITLGEEEIADVSLATFHLFDKENAGSGVQVAWRGCGERPRICHFQAALTRIGYSVAELVIECQPLDRDSRLHATAPARSRR